MEHMGYVFIARISTLHHQQVHRWAATTDPEEFACAVNAETLAEMVGSAATWLSSAVSTCVLAFQDLVGFR